MNLLTYAVLNLLLERVITAGAVRRFTNALSFFVEFSTVALELWALHAKLYLEGTAADYMQTAMQSMPVTRRSWSKFYALLSTRFGQIDPDAEF